MFIKRLTLIILSCLVIFNINAAEQILEPHLMIYYKIPLGAGYKEQQNHTFGFRMDRVMVEPGKNIDYNRLFNRQAVLDMTVGSRGIDSIRIAGVDYLQQYRLLKQNDDGEVAEGDDVIDQSAEDVFDEAEEAQNEPPPEQVPSLREILGNQYWGVLVGAAIGAALLIDD